MESEEMSASYYPEEADMKRQISSLVEILTNANKLLQILRHEFRGEELIQKEDGSNIWFQVSKPLFVRTNTQTEEPLKMEIESPNGDRVEVFIPHDEAIEEILSLIKMCGLNQLTPLGTSELKELNLDLYEFESRLSYLLTLKRKEWGIDKALRPMVYKKIKQQVQDARTTQLNGRVLKALTSTVKHFEHVSIGEKKGKTPYE